MKRHSFLSFGYVVILVIVTSCSTPKNIPYFKNLSDSIKYSQIPQAKFTEPIIQPDDILNITIQTVDPSSSASVNQKSITESAMGASTATNIGTQQVSGFLVDKNGEVEFPMIGNVKLAGLTTFQAREVIRKRAEIFLNNPSVQVRFVNFKITIIGEVTKPASYTLPNEKVTILDAIGMAGDLTIYGKRENILLIRDNGTGIKEMVRFNLNSTDIFKSPYYYLKQNDVIYVEPNKSKVATTDAARTRTYAILGTILSAVVVVVSRFF
ncbi:polysaccharide export outer membrane protein [bacterium A37T11]|nr:polysaccharide export outer membrane protein [bacterium A37T11]